MTGTRTASRTVAARFSRPRRMLTGAGLVAATVLTGLWNAGAAYAHVTVAAPGVGEGAADATIVFRVPNESSSARTVALRVELPIDTPLAGVLVAPVPGWTSTVTESKLTKPIVTDDGTITSAVSRVTWTASAGGGIAPGYFTQFPIIAGKLPDGVAHLTFKAIQTYSDGKQVAWIEVAAPGATDEPEHPAPVLDLTPESASASGTAASASGGDAATTSTRTASTSTGSTIGIVLGAVGCALGAAALAIALRRRTAGSPVQH